MPSASRHVSAISAANARTNATAGQRFVTGPQIGSGSAGDTIHRLWVNTLGTLVPCNKLLPLPSSWSDIRVLPNSRCSGSRWRWVCPGAFGTGTRPTRGPDLRCASPQSGDGSRISNRDWGRPYACDGRHSLDALDTLAGRTGDLGSLGVASTARLALHL